MKHDRNEIARRVANGETVNIMGIVEISLGNSYKNVGFVDTKDNIVVRSKLKQYFKRMVKDKLTK